MDIKQTKKLVTDYTTVCEGCNGNKRINVNWILYMFQFLVAIIMELLVYNSRIEASFSCGFGCHHYCLCQLVERIGGSGKEQDFNYILYIYIYMPSPNTFLLKIGCSNSFFLIPDFRSFFFILNFLFVSVRSCSSSSFHLLVSS